LHPQEVIWITRKEKLELDLKGSKDDLESTKARLVESQKTLHDTTEELFSCKSENEELKKNVELLSNQLTDLHTSEQQQGLARLHAEHALMLSKEEKEDSNVDILSEVATYEKLMEGLEVWMGFALIVSQ